MSGFKVLSSTPNYSQFSFLGLNFITLTELRPNMNEQNRDWFKKIFQGIDFSNIQVVLVSDPRSFFITQFILEDEQFFGIILLTEPVFRIGLLLIREFRQIDKNNGKPLPNDLRYNPLAFEQPYSLGEISFIPVPNGTGLGNSNWIITHGTDPALVSFRILLISGFNDENPYHFKKFFVPYQFKPKYINFLSILPSAISPFNYKDSIDKICTHIKNLLNEGKLQIFIPMTIDDSIYNFLLNLRISGITNVYIYSYFFSSLKDIFESMPTPTPIEMSKVIAPDHVQRDVPEALMGRSVFIAPHPSLQFGQIMKLLKQYSNDPKSSFFTVESQIDSFQYFPLPLNSGPNNLRRYISSIIENDSQFIELNDQIRNFFVPHTSDLFRFIDLNVIQKLHQNPSFNSSITVSGDLKGEKVELKESNQTLLYQVPNIRDFAMKLRRQGAINIKKEGSKLTFTFDLGMDNFDCSGSVDFSGDEIEIETGSERVEAAILSALI